MVKRVGRPRKKLIDKSTKLYLYIDNATLFALCDKVGIDYNPDAEIFNDDAKAEMISSIKKIVSDFTK